MKKVGIKVSQFLGTNAHGAESHTLASLCRILAERYEVEIVGCEVYPEELRAYRVITPFRYWKAPAFLRKALHVPAAVLNAVLYARRHRPDVLFTIGGVWYNGLGILLAGRLFGIKTVVRTAEDHFNYWRFCETRVAKVQNLLVNNLVSGFVLRRCDHVLTVGTPSRDYFISHGVRPERISGVPGPINRGRFFGGGDKAALRRELGLPTDRKVVLYVGAISGVKGTGELPGIIRRVRAGSRGHFFCVIGRETHGKGLTLALEEAGGQDVSIRPPVAHDKLVKYYQAADVFVFLTKVGVGYGQVTIEASLSGLPVLSNNPGMDVEWFLGDACQATPEDIADRILSGAYRVIELPPEFSEAGIRARHLGMFEEVLGSAHAAPAPALAMGTARP